jgi:HlyD family secretion protein
MKKFIKNYWVLSIPTAILIIGLLFLLNNNDKDTTERIIGMVEANYTDVASEVPGRLDSLFVSIGDTVKKGQVVAVIRKNEIDNLQQQAVYSIEAAQSQLNLLRSGARPEAIHSAKNLVDIAQNQYELSKQSYDRISKLFEDQVVSGQERDMMLFKMQAAQKELESAKLHLQSLEKGSRTESIQAAEAMLKKAEQSHELSKEIAGNATIYANADGVITSLIINEGELVNLGYPMMTIQKEQSFYLEFTIKQSEINHFKEGNIVKIKVPGVQPEMITAKVTEISPNLTYANWVPEDQIGQFELRTFSIKCKPTKDVKGLRAGMTAALLVEKK